MSISREDIQTYLHEHIPLSGDMEVRVVAFHVEEGVRLEAPLGPNINHRHTVFGGSAATLATLAAWSVMHFGLREAAPETEYRVVIRRSVVDYPAPLTGDFAAYAPAPNSGEWARFIETLRRRGKARLTLTAEVKCNTTVGARFEGEFVALAAHEK